MSNQSELLKMSAAGRAAVDGKGAERLAARIATLIAELRDRPARALPAERLRPIRRPAVGE
jgi:hypothetical protein